MYQNRSNLKKITQMPYYNTSASVERSEMEIKRLLKKYGVNNYRWTTIGEDKLLEFVHTNESKQKFHVKIPVPEVKGVYNRSVQVVPLKQRMRMMVIFLKSMLEASAYGLMKFEQIFFGFIDIQLPDGSSMSTQELVSQYQNGTLLLTSGSDVVK